MLAKIQNNFLAFLQAAFDTGHRVIGRADIDLSRLEAFFARLNQRVHVFAVLIQSLNRHLDCVVQLFNENLYFRCHARSD